MLPRKKPVSLFFFKRLQKWVYLEMSFTPYLLSWWYRCCGCWELQPWVCMSEPVWKRVSGGWGGGAVVCRMCVEDGDLSREAEQRRRHCGERACELQTVREEKQRPATNRIHQFPLGSPGAQLFSRRLHSWRHVPGSQGRAQARFHLLLVLLWRFGHFRSGLD